MPIIKYKDIIYTGGSESETNKEIILDSILNNTSENAVQNKVITQALNDKLNVSDIAEWAKSKTKPIYTSDEVGADKKGSADTALNSAKDYTDTKYSDIYSEITNLKSKMLEGDTIERLVALANTSVATSTKDGFMSVVDKNRLDKLQIQTGWYTIDSINDLKNNPLKITFKEPFKTNPHIFLSLRNGSDSITPSSAFWVQNVSNTGCTIKTNLNYEPTKDPAGAEKNDLSWSCSLGVVAIAYSIT